jgi:hypothetical protein
MIITECVSIVSSILWFFYRCLLEIAKFRKCHMTGANRITTTTNLRANTGNTDVFGVTVDDFSGFTTHVGCDALRCPLL